MNGIPLETLHTVSFSVADLDPFHFDLPDPDPGSKNQPKSWKISTKINENHKNIIHFFSKLLNLCLLT